MADSTISNLPASTGVDPTNDVLPIVHISTTQKVSPQDIVDAAFPQVPFTPTGSISATTVNAAIVELDTKKADAATTTAALATKAPLSSLPTAMDTATAQAGTSTTPQTVSASVLKAGVTANVNVPQIYSSVQTIPTGFNGVARVDSDVYVGNGTSVHANITDLYLRKPRKVFSKLFASASATTSLKVVAIGDSLGGRKISHIMSVLDRKIGGVNVNTINTLGSNLISASAGNDLGFSGSVSVTTETGYNYWPMGSINLFDAGGSTNLINFGVNPAFNTIKVFYIQEPGAGTINLIVGGSIVATASASNATVGLGVLTYTQSYAQVTASITVSGSSVRVIGSHITNSVNSGVDFYDNGVGGLLLANATSTAQCRAIWQAWLTEINADFVTFEMDDDFGDAGANDTALNYLISILDNSSPYADKVFIGSTPRSSYDVGKILSGEHIKQMCANKGASYLFFDSYHIMGSYADMDAIFGVDDGVHPTASAEAYAAEILADQLGFKTFSLGYTGRAINDPSTISTLAKNSRFSGPNNNYLSLETDASFGYDWTIKYPRTLSFSGTAGSTSVDWQFSHNTGVFPHVMPLSVDFITAGGVRRLSTSSASGYEFTQFKKTDNPNTFMNMQFGLIQNSFTRAQLLAIAANSVIGSFAFCSDCTGGAQLVYAKGSSSTDWVTVDGKTAI